ncbi:tRNA uridine-5-carboxymethylaminomethyl(34) synthesis GTPase MnmE [Pleionea litopenaei]|uniref:tRNA modification GTPase MnmE n=1 Tax=Pleionea litopenaei TaxID=3070815 RepID=A0AA51RRB0_9GAMM|nr:tRNA uridine-5-carboxymethylaminomethyl(34) synthesis GTPase MnmE [Pleionea sp. HL-JVS1]WMS86029.1 tRNA uridine-5-carboxymethylaminomethyl(34) synthesis GTPase MnmE [Pleionea sp. HL-JVS1]
MQKPSDTIVALATPPGRGGVGIIRLSGPDANKIAQAITLHELKPRHAHYTDFHLDQETILDQGIALFFPSPNSFTGEDVIELQGHGGPVVLDMLIRRTLELGARIANPGEFSERAFLNDKIDLAQAEAIADLIDASSEMAAKSAIKSLQGEFSLKVTSLVEELIQLRLYVEAAIDFPEEEIDFLSDGRVQQQLSDITESIDSLLSEAQQGAILRDGMNVVLAGRPNAGKSSLLNALAGKESAIVTDIPGTTRDVLKEHVQIDGMPIHIIDTAGLRESNDQVEKIGIQRAWNEISEADRLLLVVDSQEEDLNSLIKEVLSDLVKNVEQLPPITVLQNKCDLVKKDPAFSELEYPTITLSAKLGIGVDLLKQHLKSCMGFQSNNEGVFIARRRHITAIEKASSNLANATTQLLEFNAGELVAEELRLAQQALSEITGEFSADDLLGRIFSSFCIGK